MRGRPESIIIEARIIGNVLREMLGEMKTLNGHLKNMEAMKRADKPEKEVK